MQATDEFSNDLGEERMNTDGDPPDGDWLGSPQERGTASGVETHHSGRGVPTP